MFLPWLLFSVFALLSAAGAYWIGAHFQSRKAAVVAAFCVLGFFVLLAIGLELLIRSAGLP